MNTRAGPRSTLFKLFARTSGASADEENASATWTVAELARNPWAIGAIFLAMVLAIPVFYTCLFLYIDWSADRDSKAFCESVPIGSDVAAAIERFEDRDARSKWMHYDFEGGHSFRFPIMMTDAAYCDVTVNSKGRVVDKNAFVLYD